VLDREPATIPFSTEALQANLLRLQNEWETVQASRNRDAIFQYLTAVFEIVMVWAKEGKAVKRTYRALHQLGHNSVREPEPFAAVILCTSDPDKVDDRARSKWSRVLRYAAAYKGLDEPLRDFIKRKGGINECAARFARLRSLLQRQSCPVRRKKHRLTFPKGGGSDLVKDRGGLQPTEEGKKHVNRFCHRSKGVCDRSIFWNPRTIRHPRTCEGRQNMRGTKVLN